MVIDEVIGSSRGAACVTVVPPKHKHTHTRAHKLLCGSCFCRLILNLDLLHPKPLLQRTDVPQCRDLCPSIQIERAKPNVVLVQPAVTLEAPLLLLLLLFFDHVLVHLHLQTNTSLE